MPSRHSLCSVGVEPRPAARHPVKNPLPVPSPQEPASDAGSPPQASRPEAETLRALPHAAPPTPCATCEACSDSHQAPRKAGQDAYSSAIAQQPSPGMTPDASQILVSPSAVPPSLQYALIFACLNFGGHSRVSNRLIWPYWVPIRVVPDTADRIVGRNRVPGRRAPGAGVRFGVQFRWP